MKLASIDLLIIFVYVALIAAIAIRSRKFAGKSLDNFFLGGRSLPGWMTGVSYAASMVSADSAVGAGGLAAVTGIYVAWIYLSRFGIALMIGAILFAVYWRRLNTFTTLEFYELRFGGICSKVIHLWLALRTSLIAMVAWTGISLLALVKISQPILGWGKTETLLFVIPIATLYVWFSGYMGVVLGNILQVLVMVVGALVLAVRVLYAVGGPHQLSLRLAVLDPSMLAPFPSAHDAIFPSIACIAWLLGTSVGYGGDAAPMSGAVEGQRILSSGSPREACKMYVVAEVTLFTLVWLLSIPCIAAATFWPQLHSGGLDRELAYGLLMSRFLPAGLLGLVYAAILGGVVSVVSDNLNFGSQILLNDLYRRYFVKSASERHYLIVGRLSILIILALSLVVVYKIRFVINVAFFMVGLSAAEMSANWAQWWWWRFNGWGRVAASLGGGLFYILLAFLRPHMPWWDRMFVSIAFSTALWFVVTLATKPEAHDRLVKFYQRARPLGFWLPIRQAIPSAETSAKGIAPIAVGLILAVTGAAAIMAYILGISYIYVGQTSNVLVFVTVMIAGSIIFWFCAPRYIDSLLSHEERTAPLPSEPNVHLGVSLVLSWLCLAISVAAGSRWLFTERDSLGWIIALLAALVGIVLFILNRRASKQQLN